MTETRATPTPARGREVKKPLPARISLFYRQVIAELRKVIWPTRKELVTYTTVVIAFVMVVIANAVQTMPVAVTPLPSQAMEPRTRSSDRDSVSGWPVLASAKSQCRC